VVVGTCAYDRLRREIRRQRREAREPIRAQAPQPELLSRLEWLRAELDHLDEPSAHLLVLRYRLGWTLQEIGALLGLSTGAVDGRLSRLLAGLRRKAREAFHE
jgi:RNA polymerase sigma factor (sigma-70 family)